MSANHLLQLCLDKAQALFSQLPPNAQDYLSRPFVHKAIAFLTAIQSLRVVNRYLSQREQNNWVHARPWNASKELVLLTGGSSGIGKQIMQDLSKLKVKIIIFDIQEPKFPLPSNVFFYKVDLTSSAAIKETATAVRRDHGHPTILINNAGVGFGGTVLDEPEEKIRLTVEVNALSHFWTVKEFLPSMIKNDHGHIVNIASLASFIALGEMADYACSKAGALAFHESLTQEIKHWYGSRRVRTSIIHPLWVQTPMISDLTQHRSQFGQPIMTPEKVSQAVVKQLVNGNGGQVVLPSSHSFASMLRGLPNWIQERLRDNASQSFVNLRRLEQKLADS
ncbi:short-chain dehydrogenases/reductase [Aspergillus bombycis]|uniref:Short-chain dehydrogenase/reductase 3 n=1 Tax=Aspergillus bombycis TaxID=109264 RepID=A0A1F8ABJ2_9EURO|nr:short-chain dehydrogenases/reductase [Aspergillus bombycis]OGM48815.1 short-chain dehydrogenases/reductase [Aspergillus bombycis]